MRRVMKETVRRAPRFTLVSEADNYARRRFHGQGKRGQMSRIANDLLDVKIAMRELAAAVKALAHLEETREAGVMQTIERRELHRVAVGKVLLAGRALDEVALRPKP